MEDLLTDQEQALRDQVGEFVETELEPIEQTVEERGRIPKAVVDRMRRMGLFGLAIPKAYGGLELSTTGEIAVYEELTRTNACFRSRIGTSNSIGSMGIVFDGTDEQKQTYLPRIASGRWTAAFALTEPNAGSDAANISTSAALDGDSWVLNGNKLFITNGDCADIFTTIAVTDETKGARGGVSAFIVERGMPGLVVGTPDKKMGLRGSNTTELVFQNCRVPRENVIGGMPMVGQGFKTAMRVLDKGRLTMGACALGASRRLVEMCVAHLKTLTSCGMADEDLQARQFMLADMATEMFAARQMLYQAARMRDRGLPVSLEASMVKLFCTETASQIADRAMDIHGDAGYLKKNGIEMFLRDVRLYRIYEGTSEIQRLLISRHMLKSP